MKHCLIFSREIFYFTVVLCLNILRMNAVNEITAIIQPDEHVNMASWKCVAQNI